MNILTGKINNPKQHKKHNFYLQILNAYFKWNSVKSFTDHTISLQKGVEEMYAEIELQPLLYTSVSSMMSLIQFNICNFVIKRSGLNISAPLTIIPTRGGGINPLANFSKCSK